MIAAKPRAVLTALAGWAAISAAPAGACTVSVTGVAFGAYDPDGLIADDSAGAIDLACHPSVSAPAVDLGTGSSGTFSARTMLSGAATMTYNLYTTPTRTTVWGDGSGGSASVTLGGGTVSAGRRRFSRDIYGRIPAGQNVPAGSYSDTITVTVTF